MGLFIGLITIFFLDVLIFFINIPSSLRFYLHFSLLVFSYFNRHIAFITEGIEELADIQEVAAIQWTDDLTVFFF
jgi:hypothetical protein